MPIPNESEFVDGVRYLAGLIRLENKDPAFQFTGGEPSVMPYFNKLLRAAQGNSEPSAILVTNGSGSLEWWESVLPYFRYVEISYHPQFANVNHIIDVYRFIKKQDYPIDVKVMIHLSNDDQLWLKAVSVYEHLQMLLMKCGLKLLYSNFMRGNRYLPYKTYQLEYYYHAIGKEFNPSETVYNDTAISLNRRRHDIDHQTLTKEEFNFKDKLCHAGLDQLIVTAEGDVYRGWCKNNGKVGNIKERNIILPTEPTLCVDNYCRNGFDRQAKKII